MLSVIIFFPAISAILGFLIENKSIKFYGASIALIELLLAIFICVNVDFQGYDFVLTHQVSLIPSLNISYFVGIDTISLVLIVLSAFMSFISIAALSDDGNLKHLVISVLFLESTMMGVFSALDMILFYSFWELSLIPLLYIIGAFGSKNRIYAAIKFFINGYAFISKICKKFDEMIVDRSVDFIALLVTKFAYLANKIQSGDLSVMLRFMVAGFALLLSFIFLLNGAK